MKRLFLLAMLSMAAAGCSSGSGTCQNLTHASCDLDGGTACPTHQSCVAAPDAVDPCLADAGGCCFQVCTGDADCPSGQYCTAGVCAQGRCL